MKAVEIKNRAIMAELEKLNARLDRANKTLAKKREQAEKLGVADMSREEHLAWLETVPSENGWITDAKAIKMNGAWNDLSRAEYEIKDITDRIANAEARMAKAQEELDGYYEQVSKMQDLQKKEELMKLTFEQEKKEWAKDGILLESRYTGRTPSGKKFFIYGNSGWTQRSFHCFTLRINGETVFTSGEFWRAYAVIKAN